MVPGLWHAVESDDHDKVVNMLDKWSKIDISVDGVPLIDRAKKKGNQQIVNTLQVTFFVLLYSYIQLILSKIGLLLMQRTISFSKRACLPMLR